MTVKLIDRHVSSTHAKNAVETILKYSRKKQSEAEDTELLGYAEERIALQITTKRLKADKTVRPHVIPLAHPLVDPRKEQICLITKDPQREYKNLLEAKNVKFIGRVVGVTKLKGKFRGYEERRQLLKENGLFLVDERVADMMPKLLGSMWLKAKKQPTPVNLTRADLKGHLERAVSNTFMNQNAGGTASVKVATTSQTHSQVYENICKSLPEIIKHISEEWDNVQSIYLTIPGVSLPIWTCELGTGEGARWDWMDADKKAEQDVEWGGAEGEDDVDDIVVYKQDDKASAKKRKADDAAAEEPDPKASPPAKKKKKARASDAPPSKQDPKPKVTTTPIVADDDATRPTKPEDVKKSRKSAATSEGPIPSTSTSTADAPSSSIKKAKAIAAAEADPSPVSDATLTSDAAIPTYRTKTKKRKSSLANEDEVPAVPLDSIALKAVASSKKRKPSTAEVGIEPVAKTGKDAKVDDGDLVKKKRRSEVAVEVEPDRPKKSTSKGGKAERKTKGQ